MKATLEFSLPLEQDEHLTALRAGDWKATVEATLEKIRAMRKYGDHLTGDQQEAIEEVRKTIIAELENRDLRL